MPVAQTDHSTPNAAKSESCKCMKYHQSLRFLTKHKHLQTLLKVCAIYLLVSWPGSNTYIEVPASQESPVPTCGKIPGLYTVNFGWIHDISAHKLTRSYINPSSNLKCKTGNIYLISHTQFYFLSDILLLADELPETVKAVREGWQWTCQSGAVVVSFFSITYNLGYSIIAITVRSSSCSCRPAPSVFQDGLDIWFEYSIQRRLKRLSSRNLLRGFIPQHQCNDKLLYTHR